MQKIKRVRLENETAGSWRRYVSQVLPGPLFTPRAVGHSNKHLFKWMRFLKNPKLVFLPGELCVRICGPGSDSGGWFISLVSNSKLYNFFPYCPLLSSYTCLLPSDWSVPSEKDLDRYISDVSNLAGWNKHPEWFWRHSRDSWVLWEVI